MNVKVEKIYELIEDKLLELSEKERVEIMDHIVQSFDCETGQLLPSWLETY